MSTPENSMVTYKSPVLPAKLLACHANATDVGESHKGMTAAFNVLFVPDEMTFESGLADILLGVPTRQICVDARCEILGSRAGLKGVLRTQGDARAHDQLILIDAYQPYRVHYAPDRTPAIDFLYLSTQGLQEIAAEMTDRPVSSVMMRTHLRLTDTSVRQAAQVYLSATRPERTSNTKDQLWHDCLRHFLAVLLLDRHGIGLPSKRARASPLPFLTLRRIHDFLLSRLSTGVRLAELAAEARVSRFHFARGFLLSTGRTPHQYFVQCRLQEVRRLLAVTGNSMLEIAARTGFSSQAHMARTFHAHVGCSPSAFRFAHQVNAFARR